jgi:hypothetical protein
MKQPGRLALLAALSLCGLAAHASTITETYQFSLAPFTGPAPIPGPWTGSFTISFDPSVSTASPVLLSSFSSNVANLGTDWSFVVSTSDVPDHSVLILGNDCSGNSCIDQTGSGFVADTGVIQLDLGSSQSLGQLADPIVLSAEYTGGSGVSAANPHWSASVNLGRVTVTEVPPAATPEPAGFTLLLLAAAALPLLSHKAIQARRTQLEAGHRILLTIRCAHGTE